MTDTEIDTESTESAHSPSESNDSSVPRCGEETPSGTCERRVKGGGPCFMHDEDGPPDNHGAPANNTNAMTHGLHMDREKLMDSLPPLEELYVWAMYDDLLSQSVFDFDCEFREKHIDCSDIEPESRPPTDEHEIAYILVPVPTEHTDRGTLLWCAVLDDLKLLKIDAKLLERGMTKETVADSLYDRKNNEWIQLKELDEHHLCITFDRLIRNRMKLLHNGGILH